MSHSSGLIKPLTTENIIFVEICGPVLLQKKAGNIQTSAGWDQIAQVYPSIKKNTPEILLNNLNTKFLRQDLPIRSKYQSDYLGTLLVSILHEKFFASIPKPNFAEFYYEQFSNICHCATSPSGFSLWLTAARKDSTSAAFGKRSITSLKNPNTMSRSAISGGTPRLSK